MNLPFFFLGCIAAPCGPNVNQNKMAELWALVSLVSGTFSLLTRPQLFNSRLLNFITIQSINLCSKLAVVPGDQEIYRTTSFEQNEKLCCLKKKQWTTQPKIENELVNNVSST